MTQLRQPVSDQDHRQGPDDAPVQLVEYGDYECSYCGRAYTIVKAVQERLGQRMQLVFRNFPLSTIHPSAELAAEAAEAAGAQGRFWEMHDALFENQTELGADLVIALAQGLALDLPRYMRELSERVYKERVQRDFLGGVRSGVNGTPTFFVNGIRYDNPVEVDSLTAMLELLARGERAGKAAHAGVPFGR